MQLWVPAAPVMMTGTMLPPSVHFPGSLQQYKVSRQQSLYQMPFNTIDLDKRHICTYIYFYDNPARSKLSVHPCLLTDAAEV